MEVGGGGGGGLLRVKIFLWLCALHTFNRVRCGGRM